jgi:transcriptional regulator GlxA family with amidase domain
MNFGFLLFPDAEELDFIGPWEMIACGVSISTVLSSVLIVSHGGASDKGAKGLSVNPHCSFPDCPPLDYLLIPGGQGTRSEVNNPILLDFVKTQARVCKHILSVCTGSFILQAAGLLENRCATHWGSLDRLRQLSGVKVVEERFVRDGNLWTAAGVSAGIDLALALIAEESGEEIAGKVQMAAEYYPSQKRYGSAHFSPDAPSYLNKT